MSESAGLERGYRRLLAAYPRPFRRENDEEMLAVLMAGAREGQRWPGLAEAVDVLRSALRMRLRLRPGAWPEPANPGWADALAAFSVIAPLFVLAAGLLEVAVPYRLPPRDRSPILFHAPFAQPVIGGLSLFRVSGFDIALGCQVIIAALVLLGLRRLALAAIVASVGYWIATRYWIPEPLQVLATAFYVLEAVALAAAPGRRPLRQVLTWRWWVVPLLAVAAVQVLTLMSDARTPFARTGVLIRATAHGSEWRTIGQPGIAGYVVLTVVLAVVAVALAIVLKLNRYFLLLLVALWYPVVLQLATSAHMGTHLIGMPTPGHLTVLYLPPGLLMLGIMVAGYAGPRARARRGKPQEA
jgi:hypothetical protein